MTEEEIIQETRVLVSNLYKDQEGKPLILTDGQCLIFDLIFRKRYPRNLIKTFTRYGKSMTVGLAVLTRASTYPEKWAIAAGNNEQASIIMSHIIDHLFDNPYTRAKFVIGKGETEESIRRYRNKDRINFNVGEGLLGEIFITNARGALGFGAENVVEDESALIPDDEEVLVMRMLGDKTDNFLAKVGNPWESEHFRKADSNEKYHKITIDYLQGIKEGRFSIEQAFEMRERPFWRVLYECKFPKESQMDEQGWTPLLTRDEIDRATLRIPNVLDDEKVNGFGMNRLGGDPAGGGKNYSVIVQRFSNVARILLKNQSPDTMSFAEAIINFKKKYKVDNSEIGIDAVGVGKGVIDILNRNLEGIRGINAGEKLEDWENLEDREMFFNLRAAMYWRLRQWILGGGKLLTNQDEDLNNSWYQLLGIRYRRRLEGMKGKMQIMPKEEMFKKGIQSPDVADALALTFRYPDVVISSEATEENKLFNRFGIFPSVVE